MSNQPLTVANLQERFRKALNEKNAFTDLLATIEQKTKVKRELIAYGKTRFWVAFFDNRAWKNASRLISLLTSYYFQFVNLDLLVHEKCKLWKIINRDRLRKNEGTWLKKVKSITLKNKIYFNRVYSIFSFIFRVNTRMHTMNLIKLIFHYVK